ncbi:protein of unknown function [Methylocaldum szegediense]|uniref:Uncharacterized protein n=1 Tax=Methylocaldum szegediense TaxID=73780 RepID=A0ABM9I1P6_9GAMM|nr:protein of unknown function [Methylocaldum szegediense]
MLKTRISYPECRCRGAPALGIGAKQRVVVKNDLAFVYGFLVNYPRLLVFSSFPIIGGSSFRSTCQDS